MTCNTDIINAALRLRLPVFPCNHLKKPITTNGFKDATTDEAAIREMFSRRGAALIGVPTEAAGLVVIDLDIREDKDGRRWLAEHRDQLPWTRAHRSPSGGMHIVFAAPADVRIPSSTGRLGNGVDVRSAGGYVVWAGSPGYTVAADLPIAPLPEWLVRATLPPAPAATTPATIRVDNTMTRYGAGALRRACERIRSAGFGSQEATVNSECFSIGRLAAGAIGEEQAFRALLAAGQEMRSQPGREPWTAAVVEKKVRTAFEAGKRRPREAPPPIQHGSGGGRARA